MPTVPKGRGPAPLVEFEWSSAKNGIQTKTRITIGGSLLAGVLFLFANNSHYTRLAAVVDRLIRLLQ
jgi:hypothetical protein